MKMEKITYLPKMNQCRALPLTERECFAFSSKKKELQKKKKMMMMLVE